MKVRDQLVFLGQLHGLSKDGAMTAADGWLDRLGVAGRAADKVEALSLGNQQRVQLAAALVHDPELLVLDEPFSGLDPVAVDALAEVLAERVAAGTTIIFSSHQLDLCEAVAIVDRGRLVLTGAVRDLKRTAAAGSYACWSRASATAQPVRADGRTAWPASKSSEPMPTAPTSCSTPPSIPWRS